MPVESRRSQVWVVQTAVPVVAVYVCARECLIVKCKTLQMQVKAQELHCKLLHQLLLDRAVGTYLAWIHVLTVLCRQSRRMIRLIEHCSVPLIAHRQGRNCYSAARTSSFSTQLAVYQWLDLTSSISSSIR